MGRSALIIGGGPTTLEKDRWQHLNVDDTITVSTAYLNTDLHQVKSDYHIISTQTDFNNENFIKWYTNNKECRFVIESNHLWRMPNGMDNFIFNEAPIQISISPEFGVGIMARAIMWLINTKAYSVVNFVGFDGYAKDGTGQHAFHKHVSKIDEKASINNYEKYLSNFTNFNTHIESIVEDRSIKLINLGKGHPSNVLSHIESKAFS